MKGGIPLTDMFLNHNNWDQKIYFEISVVWAVIKF